MNRIVLALAALALPASAVAAERRYTVTDFDRIQVEGPYMVNVVTGKPGSARSVGDQRAIDRISVDVEGRTLRIRPNRSAWGGYPGEAGGGGPATIQISTHELRSVTVNGSGNVSVDRARSMSVSAALSGAGRLAIGNVQADQFSITLLGSGTIEAGGKVERLRAAIQGSGDLRADALAADDADIGSDTSGAVTLKASRSAKIRASGSGDVTILGTAACSVSGPAAGNVSCGRRN